MSNYMRLMLAVNVRERVWIFLSRAGRESLLVLLIDFYYDSSSMNHEYTYQRHAVINATVIGWMHLFQPPSTNTLSRLPTCLIQEIQYYQSNHITVLMLFSRKQGMFLTQQPSMAVRTTKTTLTECCSTLSPAWSRYDGSAISVCGDLQEWKLQSFVLRQNDDG